MRLWTVSDFHLELTRRLELPGGGAGPDFELIVVLATRFRAQKVAWRDCLTRHNNGGRND
ncbi:hypothetical protein [Bradyrhizobium japonicum]|uniref:hypothetical protein n=1 Tax=Bradyrhizobium japonicum TaxID=375 RepID=UPI000ADB8457|nr:hypothetical protein [Bradyrhizobium japonicum]